jgi:hypothetical protein
MIWWSVGFCTGCTQACRSRSHACILSWVSRSFCMVLCKDLTPHILCNRVCVFHANKTHSLRIPCIDFYVYRVNKTHSLRIPCICFSVVHASNMNSLHIPCIDISAVHENKLNSLHIPCIHFCIFHADKLNSLCNPCICFSAVHANKQNPLHISCIDFCVFHAGILTVHIRIGIHPRSFSSSSCRQSPFPRFLPRYGKEEVRLRKMHCILYPHRIRHCMRQGGL